MKQDNLSLTSITVQGTMWAYVSTYGGKILVFVTTAILARLLTKEDFGLAGFALIVVSFLDLGNGLGVVPALIYYPLDKERSNDAFWLGLGAGIFIYILAWFIAPFVGVFFNDPRAIPVTRVSALAFPISALGIIPEAILRKNLAFKIKAIPDFIQSISKGVSSIIFAILGFGVWSLVFGQLIGEIFSVMALWRVVSWRPNFHLAAKFIRPLLSYGLNIVSVRTLSVILANSDYLLVGRFLGAAALGIYSLGFRVPGLLIGQFSDIMGQVLFPVYSKVGGDKELFRRGLYSTLRYVSMVTFPIGVGLALVARPFVMTFFTDKWIETVPVIAIIGLATVIDSLSHNFGDIYKAQGMPGALTKLSLLRVFIFLPALFWAVTSVGTILAVSWVVAVVALIGMIAQVFVARSLIGISIGKLLDALRPTVIGTTAMAIIVSVTLFLLAGFAPFIQLIISVCFGTFIYTATLWFFQREESVFVLQILRNSLLQKR
jgi:O-antigen/teichoic acid export membrane protein